MVWGEVTDRGAHQPFYLYPQVIVPFYDPAITQVASDAECNQRRNIMDKIDPRRSLQKVCAITYQKYEQELWHIRSLRNEKMSHILALMHSSLHVMRHTFSSHALKSGFWGSVISCCPQLTHHLTSEDYENILPYLTHIDVQNISSADNSIYASHVPMCRPEEVGFPRGFQLRFIFEGGASQWTLIKEYVFGNTLQQDTPSSMNTSLLEPVRYWLRSISSFIFRKQKLQADENLEYGDALDTLFSDANRPYAKQRHSFMQWFAMLPEHSGVQPFFTVDKKEFPDGQITENTHHEELLVPTDANASVLKAKFSKNVGGTTLLSTRTESELHSSIFDRAVEDFTWACFFRDYIIPRAIDLYLGEVKH